MTLADVTYTEHDNVLVVDVRGEVDMSNADALRGAIERRAAESQRGTVLDVSDVGYIDSTGIQLILHLVQRLHDRDQRLALVLPPRSPAADALRYAGVLAQVTTRPTLEEAMDALCDA